MKRLWLMLLVACLAVPMTGRCDLIFDGTDDRVVTANIVGLPTTYPFTVTIILKWNAFTAGGQQMMFTAGREPASPAQRNGYILYFTGSGAAPDAMNMWNPVASGFAQGTGALPVGRWLFVAWSLGSATSHRFYVWDYETRTALINATSSANFGAITVPVTTPTVKIGVQESEISTYVFPFNGVIRQVAVYNKDWTASPDPFRAMAYMGPHVVATPTLLYNFQSRGASVTVRELQNTGNVGTLTNFPATPWTTMAYPRPFFVQ